MFKKKRIDRIYEILIQYEDLKKQKGNVTELSYKNYIAINLVCNLLRKFFKYLQKNKKNGERGILLLVRDKRRSKRKFFISVFQPLLTRART